jgi:GH15 family glucan-1,4-alpha-glucosidase
MPLRLEDYGLIGDTHTAALVGYDGSIDWLCVPRFDSGACFAALLGERENGRWLLAPAGRHRATARRYRDDTLVLETEFTTPEHRREGDDLVAEFSVPAGEHMDSRLTWSTPRDQPPERVDVGSGISATENWWRDWVSTCTFQGEYRDAVVRSLITLKAMSYGPSGGMVAAPTTSLPEKLGGVRNWDYRFCWIRDATLTLLALLEAGYVEEAVAWREWLLRAVAGRPEQMQLMYGVEGERRLTELELDWLPGYADSRPVRVGNAASRQFQLDVYGELMDALHQARANGIPPTEPAWQVQRVLMEFLEGNWRKPDEGIWEVRGARRQFTHSKVMAWAAVDRAVRAVETFDLEGPVERWKRLRQEIFDDVCRNGFDAKRGTFTLYYGSRELDAALLLMGSVGFLPPQDERYAGTVAAIEKELCRDGFVQRYTMTDETRTLDGLPPGEGAFLPCSFWLADSYLLSGRVDEGRALFERMLALRNDLGLLSEEYDVRAGRLVGNFPQALTHLALVSTACDLASGRGPSRRRADPAASR